MCECVNLFMKTLRRHYAKNDPRLLMRLTDKQLFASFMFAWLGV